MISKLFTQIKKRKFASGIAFLLIVGIGYWGFGNFFSEDGVIRYASAQVQKGTLIVSISGSGQVSASNQIDIKPKASGDVVYVGVKNGQEVKAGTLIAQIDARDAQKTVRDAEVNLESANLALEKLNLQNKQQTREDTLNKNYQDGMDILSKLYGEFSTILENLKDVYFGTDVSSGVDVNCNINYYDLRDCNITYYANRNKDFSSAPNHIAITYKELNELYSSNIAGYQAIKRSGDNNARGEAIKKGHDLVVQTAEMLKLSRDVIQYFQDATIKNGGAFSKQTVVDGHIIALESDTTSIVGYEKDLLNVINSVNNYLDSIEGQPLDLHSQELTVKQRENALLDAKEKLADYYVRAPFDGIIAKIDAKKGDPVSSATVLAMLITRQKLAEVSLNEVDVAQIKVGQKATLTFDAIPDLTISGQVAEVDAVGTVSQGVVTYNIKIGFDTQDDRVKTAMSALAAIVTEAKPDVLLVPNSAVKSQGGISYVEIPDESDMSVATANVSSAIFQNPTRQQQIEVGTANDEFTEVVSGLNEGDLVVTRTIQPTTAQTTQTQQQSGGLRIPGLPGGGGGGGFRGGGDVPH